MAMAGDSPVGGPATATPMTVLVAGASGLIGTRLCTQLEAHGHTVLRLVRREPRGADEFAWDPAVRTIDIAPIERADALINLSGASLAHLPWTPRYRRSILESRLQATQTLTDAMHLAARAPSVFLSASAVGIYGDRPGTVLTEESTPGSDFLATVVRRWEAAARHAPAATRTVLLRTGLVLGHSGALLPLRRLARFGLGGPIGSGAQIWPWISLHDEVAAILHLLTGGLRGPVNLVGPTAASADQLLRAVAVALHRPYGFPLPARLVGTVMGEAGRLLLLADQEVSAATLTGDGFRFRHSEVDQAVAWALTR